jgi:hypothetical protein
MPSTATPPTPEDASNFFSVMKDFVVPGAVAMGSAVVGWFTAVANMRNGQADAVTRQLQVLMAGYQEQVKLMQAGYEGRLAEQSRYTTVLETKITRLEDQIDELRKALDRRPPCESCATRAKLEEQIKGVMDDLEIEKSKNSALHVQRMSVIEDQN